MTILALAMIQLAPITHRALLQLRLLSLMSLVSSQVSLSPPMSISAVLPEAVRAYVSSYALFDAITLRAATSLAIASLQHVLLLSRSAA